MNGKIYAIGGWDGNAFISTVEEYDPAIDKWTKKADMQTTRASLSASVTSFSVSLGIVIIHEKTRRH